MQRICAVKPKMATESIPDLGATKREAILVIIGSAFRQLKVIIQIVSAGLWKRFEQLFVLQATLEQLLGNKWAIWDINTRMN